MTHKLVQNFWLSLQFFFYKLEHFFYALYEGLLHEAQSLFINVVFTVIQIFKILLSLVLKGCF